MLFQKYKYFQKAFIFSRNWKVARKETVLVFFPALYFFQKILEINEKKNFSILWVFPECLKLV